MEPARRTGQRVSQMADAGAFDFLTDAQRDQVVRAVREASTTVVEERVWSGGGGFVVGTLFGNQPPLSCSPRTITP